MKLFIFIALCLSNFIHLKGVEIISIGRACNVARGCRENKLRNRAYPFDWMITPLEGLEQAFRTNFSAICELMALSTDGKSAQDAYGLIYIHDFPTVRYPDVPVDGEIMPVHHLAENWREAIDVVKAKFNRRLNRMIKLFETGSPVVLVRYQDMTREDAKRWIRLLEEKFPKARLILAVLGSTTEFQTPWEIPHVKNFYLEESEIKRWNGPIWRKILEEINQLEPTNWEPYLLTTPNYNPGLFSTFNTVLGALDAYDRKKIQGLKVDFGDTGLYFDPNCGANWWSYYFEPIVLGEANNTTNFQKFLTYQKIEFAYASQFEMSKKRANELIQKYIRLSPHINQKLKNFCQKYFNNHFVIGLHYRGTDKSTEAEAVSYKEVTAVIEKILLEHKEEPVKIFLATDDAIFAEKFCRDYPDKVIPHKTLRSRNQEGVHLRKDFPSYQKGEEAVLDCLLLSKCDLLVKTASNLSDSSLQFSPDLPVIRINQSYSE